MRTWPCLSDVRRKPRRKGQDGGDESKTEEDGGCTPDVQGRGVGVVRVQCWEGACGKGWHRGKVALLLFSMRGSLFAPGGAD